MKLSLVDVIPEIHRQSLDDAAGFRFDFDLPDRLNFSRSYNRAREIRRAPLCRSSPDRSSPACVLRPSVRRMRPSRRTGSRRNHQNRLLLERVAIESIGFYVIRTRKGSEKSFSDFAAAT